MDEMFLDMMLTVMDGGDPSEAIERQERREQKTVVERLLLPKLTNDMKVPREILEKGVDYSSMDTTQRLEIQDKNNLEYTRERFKAMGIEIIGEYDDLFYSVRLPEGWEIKPSDHVMWNYVFDEKRRKRISYSYKGTVYDRHAFCYFECRYNVEAMPIDICDWNEASDMSDDEFDELENKPWKRVITDCGKEIKKLGEYVRTEDRYWERSEYLGQEGEKYLNQNYPGWKDPDKYWD